jgi:hypothetical protein
MKRYSRITIVPFSGFYYSTHDEELDFALGQMMADDNGDPFGKGELEIRVWETCNWGEVQEKYARAYVENFAAAFKVKLLYEKMISPREYNFTTDRIFAYIPLSEVRRLRRETTEKIFRDLVREWFTSRDGFVSSYPNRVECWPALEKWDHNQIGALLAANVRQQHGDDLSQDQELGLMEQDRGNGMFDQWISEATPNAGRFYRIRDYLQKRKERKQHA